MAQLEVTDNDLPTASEVPGILKPDKTPAQAILERFLKVRAGLLGSAVGIDQALVNMRGQQPNPSNAGPSMGAEVREVSFFPALERLAAEFEALEKRFAGQAVELVGKF